MKIKEVGLGRLPYLSLALLLLVSVWTTPALSMAGSDGVVASLNEVKVGNSSHFDGSRCDRKAYQVETVFPFPAFSSDPISECPSSFEQQVIFFINHERNLVGLPSLELDVRLQTAARWMSDDMAAESEVPLDHVDSLGRTFDVRISEEGAYPYIRLGEVIAGGFPSHEDVVKAWMNSPGHKARLLDENYKHIGVGYTYDSNSEHWFYWRADLGSTMEARQSPSLDCDPRFYLLFLSHVQR
ncbi:MAG: hypothetical protein A2Z14_12870 [Chloroflexi bacterium RBG_16_48_8]|nr:MAG: hypothetical protein A2Z14_12870 [Chloroflexi bacterium RBG_16_48_8]